LNPIPAYVRNTRLDILAWNDAIADLFVDYGSLQPHERNTLRLLFLYHPLSHLDSRLGADGARHDLRVPRFARAGAGQSAVRHLIAELSQQSPEFRDWWQDTEVTGFEEGRKRLRHPTNGLYRFHLCCVDAGGPAGPFAGHLYPAPRCL
jgi:hypothetical protein